MSFIIYLIGVVCGAIAALGFLTADPHMLGLGLIGCTLSTIVYAIGE